jgi:hypothetical protein
MGGATVSPPHTDADASVAPGNLTTTFKQNRRGDEQKFFLTPRHERYIERVVPSRTPVDESLTDSVSLT